MGMHWNGYGTKEFTDHAPINLNSLMDAYGILSSLWERNWEARKQETEQDSRMRQLRCDVISAAREVIADAYFELRESEQEILNENNL